MNFSISNIAWNSDIEPDVFRLLKKYGFEAIDVAPGKCLLDPFSALNKEIVSYRRKIESRGFDIVGMQSLLYGTQGLNMFGSPSGQEAMLSHLTIACNFARNLGVKFLVFGSPKNRDRSAIEEVQVEPQAIEFFRRLGDIAKKHAVTICLEPNPTEYGANFMTKTDEAAAMVKKVSHPNIKMQLDAGTLKLNAESPIEMMRSHGDLIEHIHASEPFLSPLDPNNAIHWDLGRELKANFAGRFTVCIEMLTDRAADKLEAIENSLECVKNHYS